MVPIPRGRESNLSNINLKEYLSGVVCRKCATVASNKSVKLWPRCHRPQSAIVSDSLSLKGTGRRRFCVS